MSQADALADFDDLLRKIFGEQGVKFQYASHEKGLNLIVTWDGLIREWELEPMIKTAFEETGLEEFFTFGGTLVSSGLRTFTLFRKTTP